MQKNIWNVRAVILVKKNGRTGIYRRKFLKEFTLDESKDGLSAVTHLYERMRTLKELEGETIISIVDFETFNTSRDMLL